MQYLVQWNTGSLCLYKQLPEHLNARYIEVEDTFLFDPKKSISIDFENQEIIEHPLITIDTSKQPASLKDLVIVEINNV